MVHGASTALGFREREKGTLSTVSSPWEIWSGRRRLRWPDGDEHKLGGRRPERGRRRRLPRFRPPRADSFGMEEEHGEAVPMARLEWSRAARSDGGVLVPVA